MKAWKFNPDFEVIEATDVYFLESHGKWFPVPKHWVGTFVISISYRIKSGDLK